MKTLQVGLDVGSVTAKLAVVDPDTNALLHSVYARHGAQQAATAKRLLEEAHAKFPGHPFALAVSGSGGAALADRLQAFFVQEVVANSLAVQAFHPRARVAIELGGEDAKVVFFRHDERLGRLVASDMRMNGTCAGGTGAFIDQVASLLHVTTEEFGVLATQGTRVYEISGRCGVFAKTDIQPLLNQCVAKEDIALSTFHAIVRQTVGGLIQGMTVHPPVIFEGGPLTFNPRLVEVFAERLGLTGDDVIRPERPELMVAVGAALSIARLFGDKVPQYSQSTLHSLDAKALAAAPSDRPYFKSPEERAAFEARHRLPEFKPRHYPPGTTVRAWLGIDAGSTTSKFVLLDDDGALIDTFYASNKGDPLRIVTHALLELRDRYVQQGLTLDIRGLGTTGYGELLFATAFRADHHTVETVAHAEAARKFVPNVSFILDIGGQDMKAIWVNDGIITGITLNEACSAGCGSFIETLAASVGTPLKDVAASAFQAQAPSKLGSRCTVFMNSSIITELKNGKKIDDILGGVTRSVVENVFTKVVRVSRFDALGEVLCVQGGTLKNDAVLRALEEYTGRTVIRPPHPGEMGAIGAALLTQKAMAEAGETTSRFIGFDRLASLAWEKLPANQCRFCTNACTRTVVRFEGGDTFISGHRCERGEILGDPKDAATREAVKAAKARMDAVPDLVKRRAELLFKDWQPRAVTPPRGIKMGLPRVLEFWNSMPFWTSLFRSLGFEVELSKPSSYALFNQGLPSVPSDTVCLPAKLVHGHVQELLARKVDRLFMPMMVKMPAEIAGEKGVHVCAVVQGYPAVVEHSDEPTKRHGVAFDRPIFHWYDVKRRDGQLSAWLDETFGIKGRDARAAIAEGDRAMDTFRATLRDEGRRVLESLSGEQFAVLMAGRPYHSDELVSHGLSDHFTRLGIPVLTADSLEEVEAQDLSVVRAETVNPFHVRMFGSALFGARHKHLEVVQVVSFGCGHDAIITEEMTRLITLSSDKPLLTLKLDEGEAKGPITIRVKSFVETTRARRRRDQVSGKLHAPRDLPAPFHVAYEEKDKQGRTIMVPNISAPFAQVMSAVLSRKGIKLEPLPLAGPRAVELGKRYLHNDICFPAQLNVGEFLAHAEKATCKTSEMALGLAKSCDDCRAGQYSALARKALDDAGYTDVPIITTGADNKGMHPGFVMDQKDQIRTLWGLGFLDCMEDMVRKTRPYEVVPGTTDRVFEETMAKVVAGLRVGSKHATAAFREAVAAFNAIEVRREVPRPKAFVIGEILLNYHPTSNGQLVRYLEQHGLECILPDMVDFFRRDLIRITEGAKRGHLPNAFLQGLMAGLVDKIYGHVLGKIAAVFQGFRYYAPKPDVHGLSKNIEGLLDKTYMVGEGWLIPAEILEHAKHGVRAFVIVQPFGCLPNHITGRGLIKAMKAKHPDAQIVSLDYDPDTSFANIENRLQMLIMAAKAQAPATPVGQPATAPASA